jgi:hypothetical protein
VRLPEIKDWHRPANEECGQNQDSSLDCTCKKIRKRKPYRVVRVHCKDVDRGVNPRLVMEIWPDGRFLLREEKRKVRFETTVGRIYHNLVWRAAMVAVNEKKNKRAALRKARKGK